MLRSLTVVAAFFLGGPVALAAAPPAIGTKITGRVATLTGVHFPVKGCPKTVAFSWKSASETSTVKHTLGTAKLARPQGTFTLVWHIPPTVHGPLYVFVDDNCVVKGAQQAYESYYSFTAP